MRKDLKKFLFIGGMTDKESFFKEAQRRGIIHFINPHQTSRPHPPKEVQDVISAIKILRSLPVTEQEVYSKELDSEKIIESILVLHQEQEKLNEECSLLEVEIDRIENFGHFSLDDISYIEKEGDSKVQFFTARATLFHDQPIPEGLVLISSTPDLDYYMAVNKDPVFYEKMNELKLDQELRQVEKKLKETENRLREVEHELKGFAKYNDVLHHLLVEKLNDYHLNHAQTSVQEAINQSLFVVEGWVPCNKMDQLAEITAPYSVYAEEVAIESTDSVPTYLENSGQARLGEDLVRIYDTPSSTDTDPSLWVLYGFALFFAFIIGDAGYGLVYLCLALFLRYKYPNLKGTGKRVLNLFTFLCMGCILWGTLMTSFFGMEIGLDNPLRKVSLLQWLAEKKAVYHISHQDTVFQGWVAEYPELKSVTDVHQFVSYSPQNHQGRHIILNKLTDNVMFELALFIGVIHLIVSFLRYSKRNWHNIGWVVFLIGAYLYFPAYLRTPSLLNFVGGINLETGGWIGLYLMGGGLFFAWGLAIIRNGWTGIFEIMTVIQVFADTLSYLRLYALGLAGAIVGSTANEIASGLPLVFGILLIMISHGINMVLATMSGIIHGLRLNFLEWYHYSFEGGGKEFQPLKLLKKD